MIDQITFAQPQLIWLIIFGLGCLWLLFIWKEWQGVVGPRFFLKVIVSFIGILALSMIGLQPNIQTKEKIGYSAILTPGYQKAQRDSLKKAHKNLNIINYSSGKNLTTAVENGQEIFLLGQGLRAYDLWQLKGTKVHVLNGTIEPGVSQIKFDKQNVVGNNLVVEGEYLKPIKGRQLLLMGPGNIPLDSVQLLSQNSQRFVLKTQHLLTGKFVYALVEMDSLGNQLSTGPRAVNIRNMVKLSVMMVYECPRDERKYG